MYAYSAADFVIDSDDPGLEKTVWYAAQREISSRIHEAEIHED